MVDALTPDRTPLRQLSRRRIVVRGAVQGVGFRPFVFGKATALGLAGWVRNAAAGVIIEAEGPAAAIDRLVTAIRDASPANARVADMSAQEVEPQGEAGFTIAASESAGARSTEVLPDLATCDACLAEMRDPGDRRYRYPFINCTGCGPRYSIVEDLPYDRERTSMRRFAMCPECRREYDDPADRRFHAEPNACPRCGPQLALWDASGRPLAEKDEALQRAADALRSGQILAVKGVGGFHLMADARDERVARLLRARKRRGEKPFAVMFPTVEAVRAGCRLDGPGQALLAGRERPIVLLARRDGAIAPSVAPGSPRLGALLPYAPLHHLLMDELGFPVVATSGNVSDEPIVTDETEALDRLAGIADLFLVHDRPIVRPLDDSVAQVVCGQPQLLRRARGYAPAPIPFDPPVEGILAFGGHLKATLALGHRAGLVVSQHLGDLATSRARQAYRSALDDLARLHGARPRLAVRDLHPDYASTRAAESAGLSAVAVQHHLAHVAACLADRGLSPPALGVAWDGTGYGTDGTIWGGEFLLVTNSGWRRVARLRPFRLPGGEAAVREPRRAALGLLHAAFGESCFGMSGLAPLRAVKPSELPVLRQMLERGVNAPLASSMGRLFDAVAALCGIRQTVSFEGQAAMELEGAARNGAASRCYNFALRAAEGDPGLTLDWQPALEALLADRRAGVDLAAISEALHCGLAAAVVAVAQHIGERRVALTGGCFQNVRLTETTVAALDAAGFEPLWHRRIPPNDGGIAFGQAAWAAWMERRGEGACA